MTQIVTSTIECRHCHKQRNGDQRRPCEHCHLRERDDVNRVEGRDLVVVASDPAEMVGAQDAMIARLDEKIADAERELAELRAEPAELVVAAGGGDPQTVAAAALIENARQRLQARANRVGQMAERRVVYLRNVRAALAAGFVMVPTFPGHVVAIRTARAKPAVKSLYDVGRGTDVNPASPDAALPAGEGRYVEPMPAREIYPSGENKRDVIVSGWNEDLDLPVEFLKPEVVKRTVRALELSIFDEIVLVRDGAHRDTFEGAGPRAGDPMVVGRVVMRTGPYRYQRKTVSFLVAWFMDTGLI